MSDSNELSRRRQSRYSQVQRGLRVSRSLVLVSLAWGLGFCGRARSMGHDVGMSMAAWDGSSTVATGLHDQVRASGPSLSELRAAYVARLGKNLNESIIGFWYPKCLDRKNGGCGVNIVANPVAQEEGARINMATTRVRWRVVLRAPGRQTTQ